LRRGRGRLLHNYSDFLTSGHKRLAGKAFTLCCTLEEAKAVREEVPFSRDAF
jgi:hypothetical protein